MTNAVETMQAPVTEEPDDVPPAPPSFTKYLERTLHDRIQAAYEQGVDHGSKHRFGVLLLGLVIGWIAGLSFASMW